MILMLQLLASCWSSSMSKWSCKLALKCMYTEFMGLVIVGVVIVLMNEVLVLGKWG
jgi:hypothetical protein